MIRDLPFLLVYKAYQENGVMLAYPDQTRISPALAPPEPAYRVQSWIHEDPFRRCLMGSYVPPASSHTVSWKVYTLTLLNKEITLEV